MKNSLIVKHNTLINASYRLGLVEQRLLLLSIVAIRHYALEVSESTKIIVTADDYMRHFGVARQVAYQALKDGANGIFGREFGYKQLTDKGEKVVRSHWVSKIAYIDNMAIVELYFTPDVISRIRELESHFTSYAIEQVAELNSKYSVRLYEIVIAWKNNGKTNQISIKDLRDRLGLLDGEYKAIHNFKARVLDASIQEINEKTEINLSYEQHKQGRKIVGFTFTVKQKSKPKKLKTQEQEQDPKTPDIFDNLTDKEREIIAQKNAYADQIGATEQHRQNLIKKALEQHRQAKQSEQERKQREKAERLAQEQQDKERLELAKRQFEQILANNGLINAYIANNIFAKYLSGLQKIRFEQGDFRGVFEMERYKFEQLHEWQRLNLKFLD